MCEQASKRGRERERERERGSPLPTTATALKKKKKKTPVEARLVQARRGLAVGERPPRRLARDRRRLDALVGPRDRLVGPSGRVESRDDVELPAVHSGLLRRRARLHLLAERRHVELRPLVDFLPAGRALAARLRRAQLDGLVAEPLVEDHRRRDERGGEHVRVAVGEVGLDVLPAAHGQAAALGDGHAARLERDRAVGEGAEGVVRHALLR